jgi:hypothetical protein
MRSKTTGPSSALVDRGRSKETQANEFTVRLCREHLTAAQAFSVSSRSSTISYCHSRKRATSVGDFMIRMARPKNIFRGDPLSRLRVKPLVALLGRHRLHFMETGRLMLFR